MAQLTPVATALARLLDRLTPLGAETVPLAAAAGRVLAADVAASWRIPGTDNSAMDGFAVRAADCAAGRAGGPIRLPVSGEARAGAAAGSLRAGTAMPITTGASIPLGADAVVPVERTVRHDREVEVEGAVTAGDHVRRAGGDAVPGTVMVPAGRRLRAADIGACAAAGVDTVTVHRQPRVAILGGGDELVRLGEVPAPHQLVDSNTPMLGAAVVEAGGQPVAQGLMPDDRESVREYLRAAAACDLVVSTAGVSVGDHDHVRSVVEELGRVDVWRVAMRPGKPVLIGEVAGTPLLGLPGNPVSSAVSFEVFGRPAVLALQGGNPVTRRRIAVRVGEEVHTPRDLDTYLRVRLEAAQDGIPVALSSGDQGSALLRSLAAADALLVVPAGSGTVSAGTILTAVDLS